MHIIDLIVILMLDSDLSPSSQQLMNWTKSSTFFPDNHNLLIPFPNGWISMILQSFVITGFLKAFQEWFINESFRLICESVQLTWEPTQKNDSLTNDYVCDVTKVWVILQSFKEG